MPWKHQAKLNWTKLVFIAVSIAIKSHTDTRHLTIIIQMVLQESFRPIVLSIEYQLHCR